MSSAADNSIKHWIFDGAEDAGRLLRFRSGHSAPPTCILHYGQVGLSGWRGAVCVEPMHVQELCMGGAMQWGGGCGMGLSPYAMTGIH